MVENNYNKYVIEKAHRIDVRYFLVKINSRYYILDFSNPKNLRLYFWMLFPTKLFHTGWELYDVTGEEDSYQIRKVSWYQKDSSGKIAGWLFLLYILNIMLAPDRFNIQQLTHDSRIATYWQITLGLLVFSLVPVFFRLFCYKSAQIDLSGKEKRILKPFTNKPYSKFREFLVVFGVWVYLAFTLTMGIWGESYSHLIVFAVIPLHIIAFARFLGPSPQSHKYQILEE